MYICICNAVNESAIHRAVEDGASNFRDLSFQTGCGLQCGSCVKVARQVLDQALTKAGVRQSPVELEVVSSS